MENKLQTILGANGTIGSLMPKELLAYTNRIRLVSRNPRKINGTDELFPADLTDPAQVDKAVEGSAVVYLLVGLDYNLKVWRDKWPKLMRAVIDACGRHKAKLVFFDNVYMYDIGAIPHMTENSAINPPSRKGKVRAEIAGMLMEAVGSGKLQGLIARSADFYGPDNLKSLLTDVVYKNIRKNKKAGWPVDADKKHSFTFTPDAAKATALLGNTEDAYGQVWHLPTDPAVLTGREMAALFGRVMRGPTGVSIFPKWMFRLLGIFMPIMGELHEMMYQYDREYFFDSAKFDRRFALKPTPYAEGVRRTVAQAVS